MVGLHLAIVAVLCPRVLLRHDPGVEEETVEALKVRVDLLRRLLDGLKVAEVADDLHDLCSLLCRGLDLFQRGLGVFAGSVEEDEGPAVGFVLDIIDIVIVWSVPLHRHSRHSPPASRNAQRKLQAHPTARSGDGKGLALEALRELVLPDIFGELGLGLRSHRNAKDGLGSDAEDAKVSELVDVALHVKGGVFSTFFSLSSPFFYVFFFAPRAVACEASAPPAHPVLISNKSS